MTTHKTPTYARPTDGAWREVVSHPEYLVAPDGKVWSPYCGRVLATTTDRKGYVVVHLRQKPQKVHVLVAAAYIGPRPERYQIRHLDGEPGNPAASNLAYGTAAENMRDMLDHGRSFWKNKTHCAKGHPYDEANTRYRSDRPTARVCHACHLAIQQQRRARARASSTA